MQSQMQAAQYQFTWQTRDGVWAYRAPNPALGLDLALGNNGLSAVYLRREGPSRLAIRTAPDGLWEAAHARDFAGSGTARSTRARRIRLERTGDRVVPEHAAGCRAWS